MKGTRVNVDLKSNSPFLSQLKAGSVEGESGSLSDHSELLSRNSFNFNTKVMVIANIRQTGGY